MPDQFEQLIFNLDSEPHLDHEDFWVGKSNETAWKMLQSWPDWLDPVLILIGAEGAGKTHLAKIWAEKSSAVLLEHNQKDLMEEHLNSLSSLVIEDVDRSPVNEDMFFHLLNNARLSGRYMLLTARTSPDQWSIKTKDLLSRLRLAPNVRIEEADDPLLRAILVKLFLDRQIMIDMRTIDYLLIHMERSFAEAQRIVDLLDREALKQGRAINRSLASEVFKNSFLAD